MDQEFINLYIENLMSTLEEYIKKEVMLKTHLEFAKRKITELEQKIEELTPIDMKLNGFE